MQASQLFTVCLQASTKLPFLGAFVSVHPRVGPMHDIGFIEYYDSGGRSSAPQYWIFFSVVVVNAIYPALLLVQRDAFMSRSLVANVDAALDITYSMVGPGIDPAPRRPPHREQRQRRRHLKPFHPSTPVRCIGL